MTKNLHIKAEDKLLILAVHPDDETLGCGGLIQQAVAAGAKVQVAFITNGDNNPWPQRYMETRWKITSLDKKRWGQRRQAEALDALAVLGVERTNALFLGLPDQGITALLETGADEVTELLASTIAGVRPTLVLGPALDDTHRDHNATAVLVDMALAKLPEESRPRLLTYLTHGEKVFMTDNHVVELSKDQQETKRRAILCHKTQMALSSKRFLAYAKSREVYFTPPAVERYQPLHPISEIYVGRHILNVRVRLPRFSKRIKPVLRLAGDSAGGLLALQFTLHGESSTIYDTVRNVIAGQAKLRIDNGVVEAEVPTALLGNAENIYAKLDRGWGFFDLAGWRHAKIQSFVPRQALNTIAVIPCYDVEEYCGQVIAQTSNLVDHVIVIDDGCRDGTPNVISRLETLMPGRISVITFPINRGKGVGLMAAFCEALNKFSFNVLVTLDADGQHPPAEIPKVTQAAMAGAEMVIGGRSVRDMPGRSRVGNTMATAAIRWLYPDAPSDTQSGLRAFSYGFVEEIVRHVSGSRYETEFQILLLALTQHRRLTTVSIPTIYIDNNRSSKFRPVTDSLRIFRALVRWRLFETSGAAAK
jgi:LmbE family N-acetylglucosaminyl deacetylase